jgi:cell division septation protein DedD
MPGQDFAQLDSPSTQPRPEGGRMRSTLSAIAVVIIAGLSFVVGYWLGHDSTINVPGAGIGSAMMSYADQDRLNEQADKISEQEARLDELEKLLAHWKKKAAQSGRAKVGELHFYTDLPKQSVTPAPVSGAPKAAKKSRVSHAASKKKRKASAPAANRLEVETRIADANHPSGAYRIQLGSFRTMNDASALEHLLRRSGYPSYVQAVTLVNKGQWFRVFAGPYASRSKANEAKKMIYDRLRLNGILKR